jgi:hypothetical protein
MRMAYPMDLITAQAGLGGQDNPFIARCLLSTAGGRLCRMV